MNDSLREEVRKILCDNIEMDGTGKVEAEEAILSLITKETEGKDKKLAETEYTAMNDRAWWMAKANESMAKANELKEEIQRLKDEVERGKDFATRLSRDKNGVILSLRSLLDEAKDYIISKGW